MTRKAVHAGRTDAEVVALVRERIERGAYVTPLEWCYAQDAGICWLCHEPVSWAAPRLDPMAPSRDHVVPKSQEGPGSRGNVRLAHRDCNGRRGDAVAPECPVKPGDDEQEHGPPP